MKFGFGRFWGLVTLAAFVQSCTKPAESKPPEPPDVTISYPIQHEVILWDDYTGYLSSPDTANVVARVSGLIVEAKFKEGSLVHQGDVLFVIDDRPFKADLDSKQADVARGRAQLDLAVATLHRLDKVLATKAISEEDYDTAKANVEQAQASLAAANAALETSQLNLGWTQVTAPITGRVSRQMVQVGNQVNGGSGPGQSTMLTSIVEVDPLYCYINIPERVGLRYQELAARDKRADVANSRVTCYIQLEKEPSEPHLGVIDFMDNRVDVNTGTVQIRGVIPNADGALAPGMFARMRIPASAKYQALLIPDQAIGTEQNERYVSIVGPDDAVQNRPVKLGALFGNLRSIISGLEPGERVVVEGLQQARPGAKVTPHEASISAADLSVLEKSLNGPSTNPSIPQSRPSSRSSEEREQ